MRLGIGLLGAVVLVRAAAAQAEDLRARVMEGIQTARRSAPVLRVSYEYPIEELAAYRARSRTDIVVSAERVRWETAHEDVYTKWENWPQRQVLSAELQGEITTLVSEWPTKHTFAAKQHSHRILSTQVVEDPFFRASGWWPLDCRWTAGRFGDTSFDLLEVLADARYSVEWLDERRRLVLVSWPDQDEIVLDSELGFGLQSRTWFGPGRSTTMQIVVHELARVADRAFVPASFASEWFPPPVGSVQPAPVRFRGRLRLAEVIAGSQWPQSTVVGRPGALEMNPDTKEVIQVVNGGRDFLMRQLEAMKAECERVRRHTRGGSWAWVVLAASSGVVLALLRPRRHRTASPSDPLASQVLPWSEHSTGRSGRGAAARAADRA